jgi:hypothetical protein
MSPVGPRRRTSCSLGSPKTASGVMHGTYPSRESVISGKARWAADEILGSPKRH